MLSPNIRDSNPNSILYDERPSQASQVLQGTQGRGWGQGWGSSNRSGSRHSQGGGDPREERQLKRSNSDPEAEPVTKYTVEIVHQGQQMQHVQPQQPEAREAQDYGCGMDNAIRSRIPAGGSSPPGDKITEDLQKAVADIEYLRMKKKEAQEEYLGLRHAHYNVTLEKDRLEETNYNLQHELAYVWGQIEESKHLLGVRRPPVADALAQVYLTKADYLSTTDVADKVRILNEEIFQAAAYLADLHMHKQNYLSYYMERYRKQACTQNSESVFNLLIHHAQQPGPEVHPLIVRVVSSIFLVGSCVPELCPRYSDQFAWTYFALTHVPTGPESWKAGILKTLRRIFIVPAWNFPTDHVYPLDQKLVAISKAVEDLQIALNSESPVAHFEVDLVIPGSIFEEWMEDSYGLQSGRKQAPNEVLVGTTGFGLKQVLTINEPPGQKSSMLSIFSKPGLSYIKSPSQERFLSVFPPKVVRESTLREALEPPPSKATRKETQAHLDGKEDISYTCGRDV